MSQTATGEYVRPMNSFHDNCKKCKHAITEHHPDFESGETMACHHVENEERCTCNGLYS